MVLGDGGTVQDEAELLRSGRLSPPSGRWGGTSLVRGETQDPVGPGTCVDV